MTTPIYFGVGVAILVVAAMMIYLIRKPKLKRDASFEYTTALNYLIAGEKTEALKKLRESVRYDTNNIDAYLKIGDILREQGMFDRAIKIHRGLIIRRNLSAGQKIDILESLVKDYQSAGKFERAIKAADHLVAMTKGEIWVLDIRLKLYEAAGQWDKAIDALKNLQREKGEKDKSLLALYLVEAGLQLTREGRERDGRLKFREAIKQDSSCPPAYLYLSDSYIRENRYNDALSELKKFITQAPQNAYLAFNRIKDILFHEGVFGQVENIFRNLLEMHPDNEPIRLALADVYERKGELNRAIDLCYAGLEKDNNSLSVKRYLVRFLPRAGKSNEALKYASELIDTLFEKQVDQFICKACGFESKIPLWRCPKCHQWDT
ncbi:MAG: tetratricopeptide repeat protein, partial [bacterium]|nr:tetratricopeptide repeat protein [bacterium]